MWNISSGNEKTLRPQGKWNAAGIGAGGWHVLSSRTAEYVLMSHQLTGSELAQLYTPVLLFSESPREFELLRKALQQLIQPRNAIEHIWVADLVYGEHELWRLGQFRARIIRSKTPQ